MAVPMGIGRLGAPEIIFKRKFRWKLKISNENSTTCAFEIPEDYVKVAARPKLEIDEQEISFLNETTWIPGRAKWQAIEVRYYDVAIEEMTPLWFWLSSVYNFTSEDIDNRHKMSEKFGWAGVAELSLYDGCGKQLELWTLRNVFPQSIDFGGLSYDESELLTIDLSLRYSDVTYKNMCGLGPIEDCCDSICED